jgi:hypothetical protein
MKKYLLNFSLTLGIITLIVSCNVQEDPIIYSIGDTGPSGVGTVFYVSNGGLNGLEMAPVDQSSGIVWIAGGNSNSTQRISVPRGTGTAFGTGVSNTNNIINQAENIGNYNRATYAAGIARSYSGGGRNDWYLPSNDELRLIWDNLVDNGSNQNSGYGNFAEMFYWTSSASSASTAYFIDFQNGFSTTSNKSDNRMYIRAIRSF